MRTYECTILVNHAKANTDFDGTLAAVRGLYETEGAQWLELTKWEDRKLAYPIKGEASACYLVGYFTADPAALDRIERRCKLSDLVLRQLVIARDGKSFAAIKAQRAAAIAAAEAAAAAAAAAAATATAEE